MHQIQFSVFVFDNQPTSTKSLVHYVLIWLSYR